MTDPRKQAWLPYLRELADLLALRDWSIEVCDEAPQQTHAAEIWLTYGAKNAMIRLSQTFLLADAIAQRKYCCHELIHCHLEPAWELAIDAMPEAARPGFKRMAEYAVDGLADAIAPWMPLPPTAPSSPPSPRGKR